MVENPITSDFLEGLRMRERIEGMLRDKLDRKHKATRVDLLKCCSHCMKVSVIHQKFPTFS